MMSPMLLAWASDLRVQVVVYRAYVAWLLTGYVPVLFNVSYTWLLPKCVPEDNILIHVTRVV